jgi:peptidoglycan/LPS O-acetylase OafA/YrhL
MSTLLAIQPGTDQTYTPDSTGRVPVLDGWRGIAIILVLFDHIQFEFLGHYAHPWTQTGQHGVTIFFVLSGFLITSKLIEGPIDLRSFYLRRFFRLMPAAWAYLATLLFLNRMTGVNFTTWPEVRACVLFYRNMVAIPGFAMAGDFWSLSLEEQFYLLWPCLLLITGSRRCLCIAAVAACACALYREVFWSHYNQFLFFGASEVRADALLVGCVTALLLSNPRLFQVALRWSIQLAIPAAATLLYCMAHFPGLPPLREGIPIAILISMCVLRPLSQATKLLSFAPLAWLGVISYSAYLWQELFVHLGHGAGRVPYICIGIPAFTLGSYYLIERPAIELGRRLYARHH